MTASRDTLTALLRHEKHQFRKIEDLPGRAQRHRYERRKTKELLRLGNWQTKSA